MGTHETIQQLSGHQGAIYDVTWADDQSCWLTAGGDGIIAEWAEDGSGEGRAVLHHEQAFYSVSAHQQMRVAGAENGDLFRWKRGESDRARRISAHTSGLFALTWMKDGTLVTGGGDERVVRWNEHEILSEWHIQGARKIRCIVPSDAGVFVGTSGGEAIISPPLGAVGCLKGGIAIAGHSGGTYAAVWHPQKRVWISGGRDGHLRVWDAAGASLLSIPAHESAIYRVCQFNGMLWTASRDKTLKAWGWNDLEPLEKVTHRQGGSNRSINALAASGRPLDRLVFGGDDRIGRMFTR